MRDNDDECVSIGVEYDVILYCNLRDFNSRLKKMEHKNVTCKDEESIR